MEKKIELLEEIMDLEAGTLKPEDSLKDYEEWDSVAVLSFIAMLDSDFGKTISGSEVKAFITVKDALDVMG